MAPRKIHTRAYPDPDPAERVDNPESILRKSPRIRLSTVFKSPLRANLVPKNLSALQQSQVDLVNPFRTRSLGDLDQLDSESSHSSPEKGEPLGDRESTPPDLHFLHNLGVSHPRSAQKSTVVPSTSVIPTSTVQTTPLQPTFPLVNPPLVNPPPIMAAWYAPLVLPIPLVNLPQDYQSKIPLYDASNTITASQHVDNMNDYFDRNEIDDDSVKLRLFAQSLGGEVRKWFKGLAPHSINDLQAFHQTFLNKWEVNNNPLQVLSNYKNLYRNTRETVQA